MAEGGADGNRWACRRAIDFDCRRARLTLTIWALSRCWQMRISGFTFVRNAVRLDYPVVESIGSILPMVDEFVVNVGESDDGTLALVRGIGSPKIRIVESQWNPNMSSGGFVLAQQTNVALFNCTGTWAIYLQADEAIHERDHAWLHDMMTRYAADDRVEGLALRRLTFMGGYNTLVDVHPFYRDLACRVVKPHRFVLSRGDAAGFTVHPKYKERGRPIRVVDTGLDFFHYADVRRPAAAVAFRSEKGNFWEQKRAQSAAAALQEEYYSSHPRSFVTEYRGTHPAPMRERIASHGNPLDFNSPRWRTQLRPGERKRQLRTAMIRMLGYRFSSGHSNRRLVASHRGEAGAVEQHRD